MELSRNEDERDGQGDRDRDREEDEDEDLAVHRLPQEVLLLIFSYLRDATSLMKAAGVCKQWRTVAQGKVNCRALCYQRVLFLLIDRQQQRTMATSTDSFNRRFAMEATVPHETQEAVEEDASLLGVGRDLQRELEVPLLRQERHRERHLDARSRTRGHYRRLASDSVSGLSLSKLFQSH